MEPINNYNNIYNYSGDTSEAKFASFTIAKIANVAGYLAKEVIIFVTACTFKVAYIFYRLHKNSIPFPVKDDSF